MAQTANRTLAFAQGEIGYSRYNDPSNGTKYGRWYAELTGDAQYAANGVAYCAMFVSYVLNKTGVSCAGLPGAYCPWILSAAKNAGATVNKYDAAPGDVVLFDWDGDGVADHVGFVEKNNVGYLTTIEGNTSGGVVARRTRSFETVIGVVRPVYGKDEDMGWIHDGKGWWYKHKDGSYTRNNWELVDGWWYHFDKSGYAQTGWIELDGEWYYLAKKDDSMAPECAAVCNGIYWIGDGYYAFDKSCHMLRSLSVDPGGKIVL